MYEKFYRLTALPFQLTPDPRLLFRSRDHQRALSYLLYGLERREGFVVITGAVGTGKTLLLQTMLGQMRHLRLSIARVALANLDADAVLPSVAGAFGVPSASRSKFELTDDVAKRLRKGAPNGALLVVDDAQTCTEQGIEELRSIVNLQADGRALVQIFLIGQPELRTMLSRENMAHVRQRVVASHQLQPLEANEVGPYVAHRLNAVGHNNRTQLFTRGKGPQFAADIFARVHQWSDGVPRRVNQIMDRLLLYGYLENKKALLLPDLEVVIAEFEQELSVSFAAPDGGGANGYAPAHPPSPGVAAMNERIAALELALRTTLGAERANHLMARHQQASEHRALVDAQLRLARLESVFKTLLPDASQQANEGANRPPQGAVAKAASGGSGGK